jgi:hypothetical protein
MNALFTRALAWLAPGLWWAVGTVIAGLFTWGAAQTYRVKIAKAETVEVRNAMAVERANATAAALKAQTEYRALEQKWATEQKEIADEADRKITQARADAAIADAAAGRLQQRVTALVAQARAAASNPAPAQAGPTADDPIGMLADVLRRADARARLLANYADEARTAGQACESAYDALTGASQ